MPVLVRASRRLQPAARIPANGAFSTAALQPQFGRGTPILVVEGRGAGCAHGGPSSAPVVLRFLRAAGAAPSRDARRGLLRLRRAAVDLSAVSE